MDVIQIKITYKKHYTISAPMSPYAIALFYAEPPRCLELWPKAKKGVVIKPEIVEWFDERGQVPELIMDQDSEICLEFEDHETAMLFKLTWL